MGDNVWVSADRSQVVDLMSPGKKWQMRRKDAVRLGLLPDGDAKPQVRRTADKDLATPAEQVITTTSSPKTTSRSTKK